MFTPPIFSGPQRRRGHDSLTGPAAAGLALAALALAGAALGLFSPVQAQESDEEADTVAPAGKAGCARSRPRS